MATFLVTLGEAQETVSADQVLDAIAAGFRFDSVERVPAPVSACGCAQCERAGEQDA